MNGKINLDIKSLKFILEKDKPYILPLVIIFTCIVLFFQFIIPQLKTLLTAREQEKQASLNSRTLKENLNILVNTDEDSLDSQLEVLNLALPSSKDFGGILNSIYLTSQRTGVALGAFSIRIGDLSEYQKDSELPKITLSIPINSGIAGVNGFVDAIEKTVPLSEVNLVKIGEKDSISSVNLSFYYKPLGISSNKDYVSVNPVSQKALLLIDKLKNFDNISSLSRDIPVGSPSAESLNPF